MSDASSTRFPIMLVACVLCATVAPSCSDPVKNDAIDALGPEDPAVGRGPLHRPNQPCLTCHGGSGPGGSTFSVAGTIYQSRTETKPLVSALVTLTDANKRQFTTATNQVGTFYVTQQTFDPTYPLQVSVAYGGITTKMKTSIGRDGSCADCHHDPTSPSQAGHIWLVDDSTKFPGAR